MSLDTLFSNDEVADKTLPCPLIVVGLPRSGSSFLSDVISQIEGWYVFDDLYLHRRAIEIGATGPLTQRQMDKLLFFLGWQIRARLRWGKYALPNIEEAEIEPMHVSLKKCFQGKQPTWADLQTEWMSRLAHRKGCTFWGYKMPQAFRHLNELFEIYPNMKLIFLMRAPHEVLASYKYMPNSSEDGHPAQYHPVALAVYWRLAAQSYQQAVETIADRVMLIKFDELVADPEQTARQIARFIGAPVPGAITKPNRPNTSFEKGKPRRNLNGLELHLLNLIAGSQRDALGFKSERLPIRLTDFGNLFKVSVTFSIYRFLKLVQKHYDRFRG